MAIMIGPPGLNDACFIDVATIRVCTLDLVSGTLGFWNLVHGTTHGTLMADHLWLNGAGIFRGIARNLGPTDTICVTLVLLEAARLEC